jgi:peptide/nickel transport system substrate-binding protein
LQEREVRQALLYALDRNRLIDQALAGRGFVADSPIPPNLWAHDATVRQYRYDPERAVGLLDAVGWVDSDGDLIRDKDGQELSFSILVGDNPAMQEMAEQMTAQWRAVGVDASVRSVSAESAVRFVRTRNFDAVLVEVALTADHDPYPLWHSSQAELGQNFSGYASDDADAIMEQARLIADPERRIELYSAFQAIFAEDVPALLVYYPVYVYAVDARVGGVQLSPILHPSDRYRNLQDWYVRSEESAVSGNGALDKTGD